MAQTTSKNKIKTKQLSNTSLSADDFVRKSGETLTGRLDMPYQPAFHAIQPNSPAVGDPIIFSTALFNVGNCYNVSNGKFTAPVAGTYFFVCHFLDLNTNTGDDRINIKVNGNVYGGLRFIMTKPSARWWTFYGYGTIPLAINDWVQVCSEACSSAGGLIVYTDGAYTSFQGFFIG